MEDFMTTCQIEAAKLDSIHETLDCLVALIANGTGDYDLDRAIPYSLELLSLIKGHWPNRSKGGYPFY